MYPKVPFTFPKTSLLSILKVPSSASYPIVYEPSSFSRRICLTISTLEGSAVSLAFRISFVEFVVGSISVASLVELVAEAVDRHARRMKRIISLGQPQRHDDATAAPAHLALLYKIRPTRALAVRTSCANSAIVVISLSETENLFSYHLLAL